MTKPSKIQDYFILIYKPGHPRAVATGYVPEHILVAEEAIERPLTSDEEVRHINGDTRDNRPTNLEIISLSSSFKSQSVEASHTVRNIRRTLGKTSIPCKYQRPCWKRIRAPLAKANGIYIPYICSFQTEGDIYHCSRFWAFFEEEWEEEKKERDDID